MDACLLDTNVLIQMVSTPVDGPAASAVAHQLDSGTRVVLAAQTLYEFWSVATRPVNANGLGWTVERTRSAIEVFQARFPLLLEPPETVVIWLDLVTAHNLKGKRIHDAHLLATMLANRVARLLTFNASDFPAVDGIEIQALMA
jgi:predicted nucleic acid-binding protein